MKRNTISNIKSIIVFSTIIILLSLISMRTEASELHNAKLDNATINRVTPENMEEYNIILKGIENEKYLINYYIERLETTPEVCEWFYVTYGSVDKIQDCILKYEEQWEALVKYYDETYKKWTELKTEYNGIESLYYDELYSMDPDIEKILVLKEEMQTISEDIDDIDELLEDLDIQIAALHQSSHSLYNGSDPFELMDIWKSSIEFPQECLNEIQKLRHNMKHLYERKTELEGLSLPEDSTINDIVYTDEEFEIKIGTVENAPVARIHYVGKVSNQPEVCRLLMSITPSDSSDYYKDIISEIVPNLSGKISINVSNDNDEIYNAEFQLNFIE